MKMFITKNVPVMDTGPHEVGLRLSWPRWLPQKKKVPRLVIHGAPRGGLKLSRTVSTHDERLQRHETIVALFG